MSVVVTSAIVLLVVLLAIGSHNRLLRARRKVLDAWRQVDLQLRRRHDVVRRLLTSVPDLSPVHGLSLDAVTVARNGAAAAGGPAEAARKERELSQALEDLSRSIANDGQLEANQQLRLLRDELVAAEHAITTAWQVYNELAIKYNAAIRVVPNNFIAAFGNFRPAEPSSHADP